MTETAGVELVLVVEEMAEERLFAAAVEAALSVSPLPEVALYGGEGGVVAAFFEFHGAVPLAVRERLHQAAHRLEGRLKEGRALSASDRARFLSLPESARIAPPSGPAVAAFFRALAEGKQGEPSALRVPLDSEDDAWATYIRHMAEGSVFLPLPLPLPIPLPGGSAPSAGDKLSVRFTAPNLVPLEATATVLERKPEGLLVKLEFGATFRAFIVRRGQARREGRVMPKPPEADTRRQHARFSSRLEVRFPNAPALANAWTTNLSQGGVFVETDSPPPLNSLVALTLVLPEGATLELSGQVVHVLSPATARAQGKRPGVGVSFEAQAASLAEKIEPLLARYRDRKPRVLVVDDSEFFRKVLASELTSAGMDVEMAEDGQEALTKLSRVLYALDLMVLDLKMPGMDGRTLLKRIRQDRLDADLKVLVLSGGSEEELANLRGPDWAESVIQKGTAMGQVVAEVKRLLGR